MGDLGRVMEDSANEAIQLLSQLGDDLPLPPRSKQQPLSPPPARLGSTVDLITPRSFTAFDDHGSTAGDSITPSHSASQALSRSSSSSSLNQPLFPPRSPPRVNGTASAKSVTPKATRDALSLSLPSANHLDTHESTPTTPRPFNSRRESSQSTGTVTSRQSARPSPASNRPVRLGPVPRAPGTAILPSSPLATHMELPTAPRRIAEPQSDSSDEPGLAEHHSPQKGRLQKGRRAGSEGGEDEHKSPQKRKSGFFGGIASIFKRKDKAEDTRRASTWDSRIGNSHRGPRADDTSDEDMPRHLVRVVNDPQARIRAMSDLGRAPPPVTAKRESRRAASEVGASTGAASVRTTRTSRTVTKQSFAAPAPVLYQRPSQVFIAPPMRAPLGSPSLGLPLASPSPLDAPAKIKKKKKIQPVTDEIVPPSPKLRSNGHAAPQRDTLVLSAEELFGYGVPPGVATTNASLAVPPALNRSNSAATTGTAATGASAKKKKKKKATAATVASGSPEMARPLPSPLDLSSSLPSSKSNTGPLILGGLEPYPAAPSGSAPSTPVLGTGEVKVSRRQSTHAPAAATKMEKREDKFEAVHGNGTWIHPEKGAGKPRHTIKGNHQTTEEGEQERSLMSIVEQPTLAPVRTDAGAAEPSPANSSPVEGTSRRYGSLAEARLRPSHLSPTPTGSSASGSGLAKRKSVRLADNLEVPASMSPPSSIRSASGTSRPGILIHRDPSPVPNMAGIGAGSGLDKGKGKAREVDAEAGWDTRLGQRGGGTVESDEDSDSDAAEYNKARKQFAKGEKSLKSWSSGLVV